MSKEKDIEITKKALDNNDFENSDKFFDKINNQLKDFSNKKK